MTGAQHGGGAVCVLRLLSLGLQTQQRAQAAVHGAHHEGVLAAAALGRGEVVDVAGGAAQRVLGVEFGRNDVGGEFSLRGVLRDVVGEGGDGAFVAQGALLGAVVGGGREVADEVGADGAGEGFGDVGEEKGRDVGVSYGDFKV
jgi:hypothetical protein